MTRRAAFRQADIARAIRDAKATGREFKSLTLDPQSGTMEVELGDPLPAAPAPSYRGWIYVFRVSGFDLAKIGYSTNPDRRRAELESGSGMAGGLVELLRFPGDRRVEIGLHKRFADRRLFGEWFRLDGAVAEWVAAQGAPT